MGAFYTNFSTRIPKSFPQIRYIQPAFLSACFVMIGALFCFDHVLHYFIFICLYVYSSPRHAGVLPCFGHLPVMYFILLVCLFVSSRMLELDPEYLVPGIVLRSSRRAMCSSAYLFFLVNLVKRSLDMKKKTPEIPILD